MMRRRTIRGLAIAGALALVLAGCGDDGGDDDAADEATTTEAADETTTEAPDTTEDAPAETEPGDDETPSSTEPETTTTVAGAFTEEEAQAIPDQVDLTLEDLMSFNPTFAEVPDEEDDEEDPLDECVGDADDIEPVAEGDGHAYEASAAFAGSATAVMANEEDASAFVATFQSEGVDACFEDAFESEEGITADFSSYPEGTRFGDQWANIGGLIEGAGGSAAVEVHVVRTGPIVTLLMYLDRESGEATAYVVDGLLTLIDERQAAAVG